MRLFPRSPASVLAAGLTNSVSLFSTKVSPSLPFSKTLPPAESVSSILQAQTTVFGVVHGNGLRSGRKRLRKSLVGPKYTMWYGYRARDILPEFLSPVKEEFFRDEEALQRLGKTRIKGKMLPQLKSVRDKLRFDESFPEAADKVESLPFDALLTEFEKKNMSARLSKCTSESERSSVENEFIRIALDREQRPQQWEDYLDGLDAVDRNKGGDDSSSSAAAATGSSSGDKDSTSKQKKKGSFVFRSGLDDKRQWGQKQSGESSDVKIDSTESSSTLPLDNTLAAAAKTLADVDADPIHLLSDVDIANKGEVDKAFSLYASAKAKTAWSVHAKQKDNFGKNILFRDLERQLQHQGLEVSETGLSEMMKKDPGLKAQAFAKSKLIKLMKESSPDVSLSQVRGLDTISDGGGLEGQRERSVQQRRK